MSKSRSNSQEEENDGEKSPKSGSDGTSTLIVEEQVLSQLSLVIL
jgi:hypothetical protein